MREHPIIVTAHDARRLRALLDAVRRSSDRDHEHLDDLDIELDRALVMDAPDVSADVITMNTRVELIDLATNARETYTLVFPADADVSARRISVLAPLGTALLGFREGDVIEWEMPGGPRSLKIARVTRPQRTARATTRLGARPALSSVR
jgi:regulator of nucleoside diphosphate kinase